MPFVGMSGAPSYTVNLTTRTVTNVEITPVDSTAGYRLGTNGNLYLTDDAGTNILQLGAEWLRPLDDFAADTYECFATVTAGTLTTGTAGSWIALSSNRDWTKTRTSDAVGVDTVVFTLEIRLIGSTNTLATATITLTAEVQ